MSKHAQELAPGGAGAGSLFAGLLLAASLAGGAPTAEQWGCVEIALDGPTTTTPYLDVRLTGIFTQGDRRLVVPGFWREETTWALRFSPPATGEWRYTTESNRPELHGRTGVIAVAPPGPGNHGPVVIRDIYYLAYADGTPYHQFGTTCYAWTHQPRPMQEQTLQTLAASPFNKIRFCVFPKSYAYNQNEPEFFAFQKEPTGKFDFSRPDPIFWRHFEGRILDLQRLGVEADIILWHPYDRWGFADMSDEEDDRYLRYCIARLGAYRNVWWSLANEFDFMTEQRPGHRGNKQWADWDRFFAILQREDPHQRLRGIHNGAKWYDHTRDWVTHASLQTSDMAGGLRFRRQYHKPVLYDECKYEGDIPQGWGNLTAREMTQRFWLGTLGGCYVGHGETYKHPQDLLWWAKGGELRGESPRRIQWLKDILAEAPPFHELEPLGDDKGHYLLAKPGAYYLLYCLDERPRTVTLAGDRPYKVDLLDPWAMTVTPLGSAPAGDFTVSAPAADLVYRFEAYAPGEQLRPEAVLGASVTEGPPPLTVAFTAAGGRARWDFGDGATSDETNPTHVYREAGLYTVTLTVTDDAGGSARAFRRIAVDRATDEPLVVAGLATGETPAQTPRGTARRSATGGWFLPDGAPWGWIDAGAEAIDNLRGLRSFTIMGWLRPDSLTVGSGGNRILFCLRREQAGLDLVHLADGRLRLAVNQWPDNVRNDSSPGRLTVGRWTLFAVTYDATGARDNVAWYFSEPRDAPGPVELQLDTRTTYPAGPVAADIGPLALGNFNPTMREFGLDRQFRGEIHALRVWGSRASSRGALDLDRLRREARGE